MHPFKRSCNLKASNRVQPVVFIKWDLCKWQ